jgi:hypothetical protein
MIQTEDSVQQYMVHLHRQSMKIRPYLYKFKAYQSAICFSVNSVGFNKEHELNTVAQNGNTIVLASLL